ncbi:MAG: septum formation initiator family protein [Rikenellaceae bacterium]
MSKQRFSYGISPAGVNFMIIFLFLCFIVFSNDESSIRSKIKFSRDIKKVDERIEEVKLQMVQDSMILNKIMDDDAYLEQYARENLYMIKKDEVIFKLK